jgi:drug/metabolite transporter (DMT)-like permease
VLTRKLAGEDSRTMLFYSALVGTVAMSVVLPWGATGGAAIGPRDAVLFLLLGLLAGLGHWSIIGAYVRAPASLLTPFTYLQTIWSTAYGYLVFSQIPDGVSALGMAVIVGSGLLLALDERRRAKALRR